MPRKRKKSNRRKHRNRHGGNSSKIIATAIAIAFLAGIGLFVFDKCSAKIYRNREKSSTTNIEITGNTNYVEIPRDIPSQIKHYEGFTLSFNKDNATPNWVAWELLGSETCGEIKRSRKFWQDEEITGCPASADYTRSGYDRGHMIPAADQKWSTKAMEDCFAMSNICPQDHALNAGAWSTLENKERQWAQRDSAILIVAGPIYESTDNIYIGDNKVRVPSAFFKVIAAPYLPEPRGIAFIYPNMSAPGNMQNYSTTIDQVEKITRFDFFSFLPDEIETKIESSSSFKEWNRIK